MLCPIYSAIFGFPDMIKINIPSKIINESKLKLPEFLAHSLDLLQWLTYGHSHIVFSYELAALAIEEGVRHHSNAILFAHPPHEGQIERNSRWVRGQVKPVLRKRVIGVVVGIEVELWNQRLAL